MSDFFGEYFAPGALFAGAGMTMYRAVKDVRSKGSVSSTWRAQKDTEQFFGALKRSRSNRFNLQTDELIDAMYFKTGRYRKFADASMYSAGEVQAAFSYARGRSVNNLVESFGLHPQMRAMGITDPSKITRAQLKTLLNASPAHVRHLERVAGANSMLSVLNLPTSHSSVQASMNRRAANGLNEMVEAHKQFMDNTRSIRDVVESNPILRGRLSPGKFMNGAVDVKTIEQLEKALRRQGRGDLTTKTAELFQQIRNTKGDLKMQLLYMNEGAKEFISGVRIVGNKAMRPIDVPIVQASGEVRLGFYGQEKMLARRVGSAEIFDWMQTGRGAISQSLDTALMDYLGQNLSKYEKGGWRTFMRGLQGSYREDVGRAIMPITSNRALNAKVSQQITFRNLPFGPADVPIEQVDARLRAMKVDAWTGLSPQQNVSGVRMDPFLGNGRGWGLTSLGQGTGDDKTASQLLRPKVITSKARARATVEGRLAREMGDVHAQIRSYSMPKSALSGMLASSSRFDIGLHEDVAILLDRNIKYEDVRTVRVDADSPASKRMLEILEGESHRSFRSAATSSHGVSTVLERLEETKSLTKDPAIKERIQQQIDSIESSRKILQSELLGESASGGYIQGAKEGSFFVERLEYLSETGGPGEQGKGQMILRGSQRRALDVGDKTFGWKRVFTGAMNKKEGQYMASLFEATRDLPEVQEALALEEAAAIEKLQDIYAPELSRFRGYMDQTQWKGRLGDLTPEGITRSGWSEIVDRFSDIQALDIQGMEKIGWRTMDHAAHSMVSDLANERVRLEKRIGDLDYALKTENIPENIMPNAGLNRVARIEREYANGDFVDIEAMRADRNLMTSKIEALNQSMARIGILGRDGSAFVLDDFAERARPSINLADRFDQILLETMEENTTHGMHKWSASQLFKDLGIAQDMTNANRVNAFKWMMSTPSTREQVIKKLEGQLQYGMQTRSFSVGGNPRHTTRSGGPGSFNFTMMRHMRTQGGVMDELGIEFAGRLTGEKAEEAVHVYRRMGAFYEGVGDKVKTVSLAGMAEKFDLDSSTINSLFGRNQFARNEAFAAVRSAFDLPDANHLVFDLGEGDNRYIYHPQEISSHTGSFMTSDGVETISDIDKSTKNIIHGYKLQNREMIEEGVVSYDDALKRISIGKGQAPTKMFSGKIQGSMRGAAVPQKTFDLFRMAGLTEDQIKNMSNSVGIRESQFQRMLADMGQLEDFDDRLRDLRVGKEAAVLARQPGTEMHRISSVNLYSVDEIFKTAATNKTLGMNDKQIINEIMALDRDRFRRNKAEFKANLKLMTSAQERTNFLKSSYTEALINTYSDNAIFLPKHMEMILGADYDDDQLDLILGKNKEFNKRLQERASMQRHFISNEMRPEDAFRYAGENREALSAAEDYSYKYYQKELYEGLKRRAGGPQATVLTADDLTPGTPAWDEVKRGQALMAQFEKGYIGQMTNSTDFVREVLRAQSGHNEVKGKIFSEMLLGIMPETALKARQHGPQALMNPEFGLAQGITDLHDIISGKGREMGLTREQQINMFNNAFTTVHGKSELTEDLLKFTPDVIDAVGAGSRPENLASKYLKQDPEKARMRELLGFLKDDAVPSPMGAAFRDAVSGIGVKTGRGEFRRHLKNTAAGFGELFGAIRRHKKPALIGTAVAVGSSMLLGSPGSINDAEANAAGARGQHSQPTTPPADFSRSTPISAGPGRSIRVRSRADGDLDMNALSSALQSQFPGADVSYTMDDYRERINEEYLRRRLMR